MGPVALEEAAQILCRARKECTVIKALPDRCRPLSLSDGYAVQERVFELLDEPCAGWFVGCTNPLVQRRLGLEEPYSGRLLASTVHQSPARIQVCAPRSAVLEVEFAFTLGHNLPARKLPYSDAEVADAVASVHPAIEVVISHLADWTRQDIASLVADNGTDGALVYGAGVTDWTAAQLCSLSTTLTVDDRVAQRGNGSAVLEGPMSVLTWLANQRRQAGDGLKAGQIHNTGSSTDMYFARLGDRAVADFGPLGQVQLDIVCDAQ